MDPVSVLLIANGLVDLALKIYGEVRDDPATPEEAKARADAAFTRLAAAKAAMDAYQPIPPPA